MNIRTAEQEDFPEVMDFFISMCEELGKKSFLHAGNQGGYPSKEMVKTAIDEKSLFIGTEENRIMAAVILNHEADPAYEAVKWNAEASPEQVLIMHALRVSPEYGRRGYGRQMVEYCTKTARQMKQKAIRLDTLDENVISQKLYLSMGYQFVDTVEILYEDIGEPRILYCYELII